MEDTLAHALVDAYPQKVPMGITAENLAKKYNITRDKCDEYALSSHKRWADANANGRFKSEIAPIEIKGRKGIEKMDTDECPRPNSTKEGLAKLSPVFIKGTGVVTAGYIIFDSW
jgi:acetyl-CoA acyltransferase 2